MNMMCILGSHKWEGCQCLMCGKTRDEGQVVLSAKRGLQHELIQAAESGNFESVKAAITAGADVNCTFHDGWTPLLSAANQDPKITEFLLANGADPNVPSDRGYTPLMRAAGLGKSETVRLLLAAGADKDMRDCGGKTAGQLARESGQFQCADMVQTQPSKPGLTQSPPSQKQPTMKTVLLDEQHQAMFFLTRGTVGGRILRVDLTFSDGKELKSVKVIDERLVELPDEYTGNAIVNVSVPFNQY